MRRAGGSTRALAPLLLGLLLAGVAQTARAATLDAGDIVVLYARWTEGFFGLGVIDPETREFETLLELPEAFEWYGNLIAEDPNTIWLARRETSSTQPARIYRVDLQAGTVSIAAENDLLEEPTGMSLDDTLVVAERSSLVSVDAASGAQALLAAGLAAEGGVVVGADGHFYVSGKVQVAGKWVGSVDRVDRETGAVERISLGGLLQSDPLDIDVRPDGTLVVAQSRLEMQFVIVDPETGAQTAVEGRISEMGDPMGVPFDVSVDAWGRLLVISPLRAYRIDPAGGEVEILFDLWIPSDPGFIYAIDVVPLQGPACADGFDNDGDGFTDVEDPGCLDETQDAEDPMCDDDLDNEGDGQVDWDGGPDGAQADSHCIGRPWHDSEGPKPPVCGLGFELLAVAPLLARLSRARRRRP